MKIELNSKNKNNDGKQTHRPKSGRKYTVWVEFSWITPKKEKARKATDRKEAEICEIGAFEKGKWKKADGWEGGPKRV